MESKLIITRENDRVMIYYMQDDKLVSVQTESNNTSMLQNIYVGKVKNIVKNLHAAFIEVQPGIMCYLSLTDCEKPIICNLHHERDTLAEGDEIIVQVTKDAMKTKDAAVSTKLSYAGRYSVISYPNKKIGYSNKIKQAEKKELAEVIKDYLDTDFGYVIRTNASVLHANALQQELLHITEVFKKILTEGKNRTPYSILYQAPPKYLKIIKDLSEDHLTKIITDDSELFDSMKLYLTHNQPEDLLKLTKYQDDSYPLKKLYRLESLLKEAMYKNVWLKSGGYLVIEPTEALTVIDVNSGKCIDKTDTEKTFYKINKEAAIEIARQLRLRNLSGIIVIDFINMQSVKNKELLIQLLKDCVKKDPVKTNVVDMTALGLVEVTRKKMESSLQEQMKSDS